MRVQGSVASDSLNQHTLNYDEKPYEVIRYILVL